MPQHCCGDWQGGDPESGDDLTDRPSKRLLPPFSSGKILYFFCHPRHHHQHHRCHHHHHHHQQHILINLMLRSPYQCKPALNVFENNLIEPHSEGESSSSTYKAFTEKKTFFFKAAYYSSILLIQVFLSFLSHISTHKTFTGKN